MALQELNLKYIRNNHFNESDNKGGENWHNGKHLLVNGYEFTDPSMEKIQLIGDVFITTILIKTRDVHLQLQF